MGDETIEQRAKQQFKRACNQVILDLTELLYGPDGVDYCPTLMGARVMAFIARKQSECQCGNCVPMPAERLAQLDEIVAAHESTATAQLNAIKGQVH